MAEMKNISDVELNVKISMGPGARPTITKMKPGDVAQFPDGYCETVKGPGQERLACILSRSNSHNGVPALVPVDMAEEARARYLRTTAALEARGSDPAAVIRRLEAELAQARAARAPEPPAAPPAPAAVAPPQDDGEDENELEAATTPQETAKERKARLRREATAAKREAQA
jgi:hypothetical protein